MICFRRHHHLLKMRMSLTKREELSASSLRDKGQKGTNIWWRKTIKPKPRWRAFSRKFSHYHSEGRNLKGRLLLQMTRNQVRKARHRPKNHLLSQDFGVRQCKILAPTLNFRNLIRSLLILTWTDRSAIQRKNTTYLLRISMMGIARFHKLVRVKKRRMKARSLIFKTIFPTMT